MLRTPPTRRQPRCVCDLGHCSMSMIEEHVFNAVFAASGVTVEVRTNGCSEAGQLNAQHQQ